MNVHTLLTFGVLPNVSATPVVMVAVKEVFGARLAEGVNVATLVTEL
jgi:predicted exporter